jgi:hypothetical protein
MNELLVKRYLFAAKVVTFAANNNTVVYGRHVLPFFIAK